MRRRIAVAAIAALLATSVPAGCASGTEDPQPPPASADTVATASPTAAAPKGATDDACKVVSASGLAAVLGTSVPEGKAKSYGGGFSECVWQGAGKLILRVSVVPIANLAKDYTDKLNKLGPVSQLGPEAMAFPGVVGIGHATSGGATVGFKLGDNGILIAVRTEAGQDKDLATATSIAQATG